VRTYYELLQVPRDASTAQIKQAFRQVIARYHPDKVQHLGTEFQELAEVRSAELTTAYKTLIDDQRRAEYDRALSGGMPQPEPPVRTPAHASAPPPPAATATPASGGPDPANWQASFESLRSGRDTLLKRAALARLEHVFDEAFTASERPEAPGFDLSCLSRPRLFDRTRSRPWLLGKFMAKVDKEAVQQVWMQAVRASAAKKAAVSVFLLSGELAAEREIADAIATHRRRSKSAHPIVIIPVDVRDWRALVPDDADPAVRSLAARLRTA